MTSEILDGGPRYWYDGAVAKGAVSRDSSFLHCLRAFSPILADVAFIFIAHALFSQVTRGEPVRHIQVDMSMG